MKQILNSQGVRENIGILENKNIFLLRATVTDGKHGTIIIRVTLLFCYRWNQIPPPPPPPPEANTPIIATSFYFSEYFSLCV